jgi:hypothetical protein
MIEYKTTELHKIVAHKIGSQAYEEALVISQDYLVLDMNTDNLLKNYFLGAFKSEEYFQFSDETDINLNQTYITVKQIFEQPDTLLEQSKILANRLFEESEAEKIRSGVFFAVYFKDIRIQNELVDAIGLFKIMSKENFMTITQNESNIDVLCDVGTSLRKLDHGALILNLDADNGYYINLVNKGNVLESECWANAFLTITQRKDNCYNTQNILTVCQQYFDNHIKEDFDVKRIDQVDLLNRTISFFKDESNFNIEKFEKEVIGNEEVIENFKNFKNNFLSDYEIELDDDFYISDYAVKKQARYLKSIIKLDKNFHIYVHGNKRNIEQGTDDNGKYYKLYYKEES